MFSLPWKMVPRTKWLEGRGLQAMAWNALLHSMCLVQATM